MYISSDESQTILVMVLLLDDRMMLLLIGPLRYNISSGVLFWSSAHALGGVSGVASFITTDEQLR